jgi:hypothetical protein
MNYMQFPQLQVTVGSTTYLSRDNVNVEVIRHENGFDTATIVMTDTQCSTYPGTATVGTAVQIDVKDIYEASYTTIFKGIVRFPVLPIGENETVILKCLGAGYGLGDCVVAQEYGTQSKLPTIDTLSEILTDASNGIIPKWVNHYFETTVDTGFNYDTTYVDAIAGAINYLIFPYKPASKCLDDICDLVTALKAGGAGPHWIVDTADNLRVKLIGDSQVGWPKYYGGSQAEATVVQDIDLVEFNFEPIGPEANCVVYYGAWRRPSGGDAWTNLNAGGWTNLSGGTTTIVDYTRSSDLLAANANSGQPNVTVTNPGSFFVLEPVYISDSANAGAERHYISNIVGAVVTLDSNLEVNYTTANGAMLTKDGAKVGTSSIQLGATPTDGLIDARFDLPIIGNFTSFTDFNTPNFNLFIYSVGSVSTIEVLLNAANGYFSYTVTPKDHDWVRISLPVGPFKMKETETWTLNGHPDWSSITSIEVSQVTPGASCYLFLDGMYFGDAVVCRVARSAFASITSEHLKVKVFTDDQGKDDSLLASDDSGLMAQMAYSEWLQNQGSYMPGTITTPMIKGLLPGEQLHIHAKKTPTGSFTFDKDMRVTKLVHRITGTATTEIELTDDLTNTHARKRFEDANRTYAAIRPEFQDRQATSQKVGDLDIRIPRLEHEY